MENEKSNLQNVEFETEGAKVSSKSRLTKEFWNNAVNTSPGFAKQLQEWKESRYSEEKITRLALLKNLREVFMAFGFGENEKPHYEKEEDEDSDLILEIETYAHGVFRTRIKLSGPEIVIDCEKMDRKGIEELKGIFSKNLKELGVNISPIVLFKGESYSSKNDSESPDNPPNLPSSAGKISEEDWKNVWAGISEKAENELRQRHWDMPEIGAKGLRTKYGMVNGELVWCDGQTAIFDTPQGKIKIAFDEVLDPFGLPYGERGKKEREKKRKRHEEEEYEQVQHQSI